MIDPAAARDETTRRYFLREARAMAALEHENVVPIYRVGEADGVLFLTMPVLRGRTLDAWLADSPHRPLAAVLRVAREVAEGLAAAHAKGLAHRDIKPANVWLEESRSEVVGPRTEDDAGRASNAAFGRVKLLDFGLARSLSADQQITAKEFVVGTPGYLAPELIQGETPTPACDLFGLGALLYQCFAGEPPFRCASPLTTMLATITVAPVELADRVPDLPEPVAELVMSLLAKSPDHRPASARAVANRLSELERDPHCAGAAVVAPVPAMTALAPALRPWVRKAVAALIAAVGVALAIVPFATPRQLAPPPQPAPTADSAVAPAAVPVAAERSVEPQKWRVGGVPRAQ